MLKLIGHFFFPKFIYLAYEVVFGCCLCHQSLGKETYTYGKFKFSWRCKVVKGYSQVLEVVCVVLTFDIF
jgi:hypothetical protein